MSDDVDIRARAVMQRVARTFDLAARLLPAQVRADVRRLYLVLRTLDDLVDDGDPSARARVERVAAWAAGGRAQGPEARLLAALAERHPALPRDAVVDFCAGMRFDIARGRIEDETELDRYCYQVAGTVGRLMAVVLGVRAGSEREADDAARALGCAMQRTNILRDLLEDGAAGRVYVPATALRAVGVPPEPSVAAAAALANLPAWPESRRRALLAGQIARADADYERGLAGLGTLRTGRWAIAAAGRMYRQILREIERDGYGASGRRAVVPAPRKALIVASSLTQGR